VQSTIRAFLNPDQFNVRQIYGSRISPNRNSPAPGRDIEHSSDLDWEERAIRPNYQHHCIVCGNRVAFRGILPREGRQQPDTSVTAFDRVIFASRTSGGRRTWKDRGRPKKEAFELHFRARPARLLRKHPDRTSWHSNRYRRNGR
jgi:hypothetical protein